MSGASFMPNGPEWRCADGHTAPKDYDGWACPICGKPFTRVLASFRVGDESDAEDPNFQ